MPENPFEDCPPQDALGQVRRQHIFTEQIQRLREHDGCHCRFQAFRMPDLADGIYRPVGMAWNWAFHGFSPALLSIFVHRDAQTLWSEQAIVQMLGWRLVVRTVHLSIEVPGKAIS